MARSLDGLQARNYERPVRLSDVGVAWRRVRIYYVRVILLPAR
jgi:hypothetical protein